jgi:hypothetical protein
MTSDRASAEAASQPSADTIGPEMRAMRDWQSLIRSGGIPRWERAAVAAATAAALKDTRNMWLEVLEDWERQWEGRFSVKKKSRKKPRRQDWNEIVYITGEIKRLRRLLSIKPSREEVRRQTRERVRAFRARKKAAAR